MLGVGFPLNPLCKIVSRHSSRVGLEPIKNIYIYKKKFKTFNQFCYEIRGSEVPIPEKAKKSVGMKKDFERKPQKPPFVKNLFMGKFDRDLLTYPEVLSREDVEMLNEIIEPVENFMETEVNSKQIDNEGRIPPEILQGLKDLGLCGLEIPAEYGGLGLNATGFAKISEAFAIDSSIAVTLHTHQATCSKCLLLNGTEAQKQKYLPLLSSGQWTAAFCLAEEGCGSDASSVMTTATPEADGSGYRLSGSKTWVTNGESADLMVVIARRIIPNKENPDFCAFIVEKIFEGVSCGHPKDKIGIRGTNTCEVRFNDVFIPNENVLGEKDDGYKVATDFLGSGAVTVGSGCASILRHLMKLTVEHVVTREQFGQTLSQFGLIKEQIALVATDIYAMEAMAYLTTGLADAYVDQDVAAETAIVKVFCSEKLSENVSKLLTLVGTSGFSKDFTYERFLRDSRIFELLEGTTNINKLYIGLCGLKHAGAHIHENVKKMRNPFMFPDYTMKKVIRLIEITNRKLKLDLDLYEFLHPSLRNSADNLEKSTKKFAAAVEAFLGKAGQNVNQPDEQSNLKRIADIAIDLYAMTAVLGRASRSRCIGIHNCDHEMLIAQLFVLQASARVESNVESLMIPRNEIDEAAISIADNIFQKKGFAAMHPLTRTFW